MNRINETFRHAFRRHPAGVAILTARGQNGPVALTISSLISVSVEPPPCRVLIVRRIQQRGRVPACRHDGDPLSAFRGSGPGGIVRDARQ